MVMSAVSSVSTPRVGDGDAALGRLDDVDVVDAVAEIGDQLQAGTGLGDDAAVDAVGDGRHQHVGDAAGLDQLGLAHRPVGGIEADVEQLAHARLDDVGQLARHHHQGLLAGHVFVLACWPPSGAADVGVSVGQPLAGVNPAEVRYRSATWVWRR